MEGYIFKAFLFYLFLGLLPKVVCSQEVQCDSLDIKCTQLRHGEYVITNKTDYLALLEGRSPHPNCQAYQLPEIDFSRYTLVGLKTSVRGCDFPVVTYDCSRENDDYVVSILIERKGLCKRNNTINLWLKLSKVVDPSRVKLEVTRKG